jgi:cell division protein FtsN
VQFLQYESEQYLAEMERSGRIVHMAEYNARPRQAVIVERTVTETAPYAPVGDAAPVNAVASAPLPGVVESRELAPRPVSRHGIIREAWADDNVSLPEPPQPLAPLSHSVSSPDLPATLGPEPYTGYRAHDSVAAYMIQAGSFSSAENAHRLASRLGKIHQATAEEVMMGGRTWWRVRLGPFGDLAAAQEVLGRVQADVPDARIVRP